jgi:outer membrane protein assembly factor BamA
MSRDPFSDTLNYSVNATVRQPTVFGTFATPALSLFRERRGEYRAYLRTTFIGGEASLFKTVETTTSLRFAYSLEYGKTSAEPALLCAVFNRCDPTSLQQIQSPLPLAIASAAVARVRTDNAVNPRSGYLVRAESRNSATFIGSNPALTFAKAVGDFGWYHPLGWGNVFALRLRGGAIFGGGASNGTRLPPPQERLYAGGATSVRGFQQNELGELLYVLTDTAVQSVVIDDTTQYFEVRPGGRSERVVPVGGNSLFVANIDYRVRDPFFPELLQYTFFSDVGSVWNREQRLKNLGFRGYWTPGVGVRVFSPVGPIQVNVGYNRYDQRKGPALYTPSVARADVGYKSVYCAVSADWALSNSPPLVHNRPDDEGNPIWVPDGAACPNTFQPPPRNNFWRRLTFTISIGPDF